MSSTETAKEKTGNQREKIPILLLEDEKEFSDLVRDALVEEGYSSVDQFDDGLKAWEAFEKSERSILSYRLVISDWKTPGMSGLDFLEKIREHPRLDKTPFIFMSGFATEESIRQAGQKGVAAILLKPFNEHSC